MLDNIKNMIHQNINELFATAAVDELANDIPAYKDKLYTIAQIAEVLGIDTEIVTVSLELKPEGGSM